MASLGRMIAPLIGLMGARLAGAGFGFLSQLVLARAFPPDQVGVAFLAISVTTFMSLVITGGYHTIGLTYLARFQAFGRPGLIASFLAAARKDMIILAMIAVIVASGLWFIPADPGLVAAGFWGTIAAVPLAAIRLNNSAANAQRRFALSYAPDFVFRSALLLALVGLLVLFGLTQSTWPVLVALPVIALIVAIGQAMLLGADNAWPLQPQPVNRDMRVFYRRRAIAMLAVTIAGGATADLVVMIGGLFLEAGDLAVLGVAIRIAALVGFFAMASQQFVLRDLVTARSSQEQGAVDILLWRTNLAGAGTMLVAIIGTAVLGPWILSLFGPHYAAAYWPMLVFLLSQAVRVLGGMNAQLLALSGHQVRSAVLCILAIAALVVGALLLAPFWGIMGIAWATLAAELFWAVGLGVLTQRLEGRRGDFLAGLFTHQLLIPRR
ncbi:polysaccharide biosynthesis C-terminal domain-containing protein [Devosia sp. 2618]|uniref:lipopolysaccharide biosynthesis protein n=1 Tax=Devosia sp. 2618 TaxID=3156454 RepID=UPI0033915FA1